MYQPPVPGPGMPGTPRRDPAEWSGWLIAGLPLILALIMLILTPTYFRPMLQSGIGWLMLAAAVVLEVAALGAISWGSRRFRGRAAALKLYTMLVMIGLVFPTLWLVLLGPAIVVIINAKGG